MIGAECHCLARDMARFIFMPDQNRFPVYLNAEYSKVYTPTMSTTARAGNNGCDGVFLLLPLAGPWRYATAERTGATVCLLIRVTSYEVRRLPAFFAWSQRESREMAIAVKPSNTLTSLAIASHRRQDLTRA